MARWSVAHARKLRPPADASSSPVRLRCGRVGGLSADDSAPIFSGGEHRGTNPSEHELLWSDSFGSH
jgi:hypothetical protein